MAKLRTHKATAKRFRVTKRGKLIRRKAGQDHFNARESSIVTRRKRRDKNVDHSFEKIVRRVTPYR